MNAIMKCLVLVPALAIAGAVSVPREANAWTKFKNNTAAEASVAHAFSSIDGWGCGYFDQCNPIPDVPNSAYHLDYYFVIAKNGGSAIVESHDFENAIHQFWARNALGATWSGGGDTFHLRTPGPGQHCEGEVVGNPHVALVFKKMNTSRCCGAVDCAGGDPVDLTMNLN